MSLLLPRLALALLLLLTAGAAQSQNASPHAIEIPRWFVETFLDLREDAREASKEGKRLMIYFGQDGCPYCKLLMQTTFTETRVVQAARAGFVPIALNLWGDREVTWIDGRRLTEKQLGALLKVQFTPSILFFNERAEVVLRLNGYQSPQAMEAALRYVAEKMETKRLFSDYVQTAASAPASPRLHDEPFFIKPPYRLERRPGGRPLLVVFERVNCASCDELHADGLRRSEIIRSLSSFDVARLEPKDPSDIVTPAGQRTTVSSWARALDIVYAPTLVFFDTRGAEVFRADAYLRPFHLASTLEYVATGAYKNEPSFQRFIQARADRLRAEGQTIDLMK